MIQSNIQTAAVSQKKLWTGRIMSGVAVLFLLFDSITKVIRFNPSVETTVQLGYPGSLVPVIGVILLACTVVYIIPRTSVFGAILLTGFLGGAVATHVRVENPLISHTLFPVYLAILLWGGLFLTDDGLRSLIPFRKGTE